MKLRALTIGLALSFPLLASAQTDTSVTLYGLVDTGIEFVNRIPESALPDAPTHSSAHFTNLTGSLPSRWGLRGTEKINDNLSAIFVLESGFNTGTGTSNQGGRFFGRQAFVGLKGDWGQVAFGRQYNMLTRSVAKVDLLGPADFGSAALDSYIPNGRMDNSITYVGSFSGFNIGLGYARGRDTVKAGNPLGSGNPGGSNCGVDYASQSACAAYTVDLGYDAANWGVTAAYDVITGSSGRFTDNYYGLQQGEKDRRFMVGAYAKFDALKVSAYYINRKTDAANGILLNSFTRGNLGDRSDLYAVNATYGLTSAVTLQGGVYHIRFKDADNSSNAWYYTAGATYSLSKRTALYANVAYIKNKGDSNISASSATAGLSAPAGRGQTAGIVGMRHSF